MCSSDLEHLLPLTNERADTWLVFFAFLGRAIGDRKLMNVQMARYRSSREFFESEIRALVSTSHLPNAVDIQQEGLALASFVDGLALNSLFSPAREQHELQRELLRRYINQSLRRINPPRVTSAARTRPTR